MKPILFSTNYSEASANAGDYAAQLAKLCGVPLIVLHSWTVPVLTPEDAVMIPPAEEFHKREKKVIEDEVKRLRSRWGIQVSGVEVNSYTTEEIEAMHKLHEFSLVVLGMHYHNFCSRLLGSVATSALHHAGYPILLVPDKATYSDPQKVLMAVDINHKMDEHSLDTLKFMVRKMNASLELVNVESPAHLWEVGETPALLELEHSLRYIEHKWNVEVSEDAADGILHSAKKVSADWIAVAPRHFSWFEEMFKRGLTDKIAFTTDRPLLILPAVTNKTTVNTNN